MWKIFGLRREDPLSCNLGLEYQYYIPDTPHVADIKLNRHYKAVRGTLSISKTLNI